MAEHDDQSSPIRFRDIRDSHDFSIGPYASTHIHGDSRAVRTDISARLDKFLELLAKHQDDAADAAGARECAVAAREELAAPAPRWRAVRGLLAGAAAGAAGVAALTDAIKNILALISHIPA